MKFNLKNVFMTVCILCIKTAKRGKLLNDMALEAISAGFYSSCATRQVVLLAKRDWNEM